jgi:hypothetical protein
MLQILGYTDSKVPVAEVKPVVKKIPVTV